MLKLPSTKLESLKPSTVHEEFLYYWTESSEHRFQMSEDVQFALGNQLTPTQANYLKSIGQSDQPNNKIKPAVEQVLANVASGSPDWSVRPRKMDNSTAFVLNRLMMQIWDDSEGDREFRQNAKDFIEPGKSHLFIYPDWNADNGLGALRIISLDPQCVLVSPNTTKADFSNSKSIIYSDIHTKTELIDQYPRHKKKIEEAKDTQTIQQITAGLSSRDSVVVKGDNHNAKEDKIRGYIRFAPIRVAYMLLTNNLTGKWRFVDDEQYEAESKDLEYQEFLKEKIISEEIIYKRHIRESFFIGDQEIYDNILPISEYPIKTACNNFQRTPYPSGDVRHAKGPQRKLNRVEALIIAHATATAGINVGYEEGAIDASEMLKMNLPGRVPIKFNPGGLTNKRYHEFGVAAVNTELYHEKARYENDIETVFGAYKFLQGDAGQSPGTVGEAQILDEASSRKQNWKILPLYDMLNGIARVAVEWIPHVYKQQRLMKITHPDGREEDIALNELVADRERGIQKIYDMQNIDAEIRVVVGSARRQSPLVKLNKDLMLLNAGIYDITQVILNMEENVDKQALLKRMDERARLAQQVQALEEENKKLHNTLVRRENEAYHDGLRLKISEGSKEVDSAVKDVKASIKAEKKVAVTKIAAEVEINSKTGTQAQS